MQDYGKWYELPQGSRKQILRERMKKRYFEEREKKYGVSGRFKGPEWFRQMFRLWLEKKPRRIKRKTEE